MNWFGATIRSFNDRESKGRGIAWGNILCELEFTWVKKWMEIPHQWIEAYVALLRGLPRLAPAFEKLRAKHEKTSFDHWPCHL